MFKKAACCKDCNEQYSMPRFSLLGRTKHGRTCPKCSDNQRKCSLLAHQTELQKETTKEKCLTIQKEKEINEGKHLAVEQEKEERKALQLQQQHEQKETEKRRH